ncbi:cancer-associated gene 1 protein isoform X2 [Lemur catta]|uniref:cancer-associated gene 1 protein isoform X2 n=1 Tax=Lemur catta TaxID=9447 RepID=UPI001E26BDDE|nr:cancer-associated gene 1 protein isoform X2 [Lemur catta]
MSESDALNVSSLFPGLTLSKSPIGIETSSITSDSLQSEIKNLKREDDHNSIFSEDVYNLLGDNDIENYSQKVLIQPVDTTSISSLIQFERSCQFHWTEAFNDEMTEKTELQSHVYYNAKDTIMKQDSFNEENPMEASISTNKDRLAKECVRQPPESPPLLHCGEETLEFTENSLANSAFKESALTPSQPQRFFYKESVHNNIEKPFYKENSFNLLDVRVNYEIEESAFSSKEIQNSGEIPEMSVSYQNEVTAEGVERPGIVSSWSLAGISWSSGTSQENWRTPDMEESFERLQPREEYVALNEVLWKLKHTNRQQQEQIQDLQCSNLYLEKKVKELQLKMTKQQVFVDMISKLKENFEELIEDKYKVILEKHDIKKTLQNLQEILANTQKHLQESRNEKQALHLECKKTKANYMRLQERYMTEMQQKNKSVSECLEMDKTLSEKEKEIEMLHRLKRKLERATASALDLLKREKETREQEFFSLQEEFQKREKENLEERKKLKSGHEKLLTEVKNLHFVSENERAKNAKLQQHINEVENENAKLKQQVARSEEQSCVPKFERAQLKEQLAEVMESDIAKDTKMINSNLFLNCPPCEEEGLNSPDMKRTSQLASKMHSLLPLMDITNPDAEHLKEGENVSDIMLQKLKSFHLKKKILDKEILKHKDRIITFRELIANEKAFQDHVIEVTDFDSDEAKNVRNVPILLGVKLDKYHNLNEELAFLITSYEEIIEYADQSLEISRSQIAHLEERNKHLEDLIRRPKERARKPRTRSLENHLKSMTVCPAL